jgi:hypothetical protein
MSWKAAIFLRIPKSNMSGGLILMALLDFGILRNIAAFQLIMWYAKATLKLAPGIFHITYTADIA